MTEVSRTVSAFFLQSHRLKNFGSFCLVLGLSAAAFAQVQVQEPGVRHPAASSAAQTNGGKPSATVPATTPAATEPVSQLELPPKQAEIDSQANSLTIRADNASLTQTLQRIADKTGMKIEGVSGDQRVFGKFGPGAPRDVLSTLLTGTGYNILMIGALDNGAPRQLILTQKKSDGASGQGGGARQQPDSPSDDDSPDQPVDDQPPPPPNSGTAPGIRTPQQMMQQMQQMRQQSDQQQANQPQ